VLQATAFSVNMIMIKVKNKDNGNYEKIMSSALETCRKQVKNLSVSERAMLLKALIEELDELDEQNLEKLWIEEALKRFQDFKAGKIKARPGIDVFTNARAKLRDVR